MTKKQQAFVNEYLLDFNGTQAAIRAGYSERSARQIASRLLTNDDIKAEVKARIDEIGMKADEVVLRLSDMGRADIKDFMDIEAMSFHINLKKAEELGLTHLIKKVKQRTTITLKKDGDEEENHYIEFELHDAQSALDKLGRVHRLFIDRKEVTGKDGGPLVVVHWDDDEGD